MKVQPVASPTAIQQPQSNAQSAKARAVAAFQNAGNAGQQPTQQVVQNQSAVTAEEMGAIQAPTERQSDDNVVTQAETTTETTTPVETPKTTEDTPESRRWAQLARQEKMLRAKAQKHEQELKAREAAIAAREAALTSQPQTDMSRYLDRNTLKQDPLAALAEAGVSYEELTQQIISQQPIDPRLQNTIKRLESKIAQMEQENQDSKKSYADNQTQAYEAAVKQIGMDVKQLVKNDPTYEAIRVTGSTKDVVELITETYKKDGILLTVEDAAQQVEDYLVEEGAKIARIEKIKKKIQASAPQVSSKAAQTLAEQAVKKTQPMKTLTNNTSSTRQLSAKERAILAFKGELKS